MLFSTEHPGILLLPSLKADPSGIIVLFIPSFVHRLTPVCIAGRRLGRRSARCMALPPWRDNHPSIRHPQHTVTPSVRNSEDPPRRACWGKPGSQDEFEAGQSGVVLVDMGITDVHPSKGGKARND